MKIQVNYFADIQKSGVLFQITDPIEKGFMEIDFSHTASNTDYILFPGSVYNGNQFHSIKKNYPPMYTVDEASVDMPVTITDVPRLELDGSGSIQLTTGDVSVPCVGIFSRERKKGILLFTIQEINGHNLGLSYTKGVITISYPSNRKNIYRWPFLTKEQDEGLDFFLGDEVFVPYRLLEFDCENLSEFYQVFFEHRKEMQLDDIRPEQLEVDEQISIQRDKFNKFNWREPANFYGTLTNLEEGPAWQPGWVGGGMSSYALLKLGSNIEQERALQTLEHLFFTQSSSGFFFESTDENGIIGKSFHPDYAKDWHLIRKSGDVLYFLFKTLTVLENRNILVPPHFVVGTQKLADAFANLWKRYGQFGQFANLKTGELIVGGSTSCGMVPAGLALAAEYFDNKEYLDIAKASAELYCHRDLERGYTTGGPGEILQCPDSESAFALLESLVVLYEVTKEDKWLTWAKDSAHLASSWVMSYNYQFPNGSEFNRLDMKTVGTVFANAQNKHSAPGICTLSGDCLYKLYQWTKEEKYLELLKDISGAISQYMSTDKRPIYSWDVLKDAVLLSSETAKEVKEKLPQGFICERVNTSDWEGESCVGGVFKGSCWSETANLLTLAEVVSLLSKDK